MVKSIDEVGSELQLEPLGKLEVLVQTKVHVGVMRCPQVSKLIWASAELTDATLKWTTGPPTPPRRVTRSGP